MDLINGRTNKILESSKLRARFSKSRPRMTHKSATSVLPLSYFVYPWKILQNNQIMASLTAVFGPDLESLSKLCSRQSQPINCY